MTRCLTQGVASDWRPLVTQFPSKKLCQHCVRGAAFSWRAAESIGGITKIGVPTPYALRTLGLGIPHSTTKGAVALGCIPIVAQLWLETRACRDQGWMPRPRPLPRHAPKPSSILLASFFGASMHHNHEPHHDLQASKRQRRPWWRSTPFSWHKLSCCRRLVL